ncbi:MAG: DUF1297 domain-containing protein [Candidatus Peribacteraceae bacterium]|nr:DUF1297 domain-containing protein [Candidatus Peribacteraceae bacterium]
MDVSLLLKGYDLNNITVGVLGGHSALDVGHGVKKHGFRTVAVARKGREQTYGKYFKARDGGKKGCIDEVIIVDKFSDLLDKDVQEKLRKLDTIFIHSRYFWVYFEDFERVENEFQVPIFGSRSLLKVEERDQHFSQYDLLSIAGIRTPKIFKKPQDIDCPVIVKASEVHRGYERAFFIVNDAASFEKEGTRLEREGKVSPKWREATIEEFVVGAPVNFNFFYSPLTGELELLGTDMRRQTNLDGFLRLLGSEQEKVRQFGIDLKMIETGHVACTVKESILEKAFSLGEKFVEASRNLSPEIDPSGKGMIGPFALQGAVVAEEGKEDIVIFDVSLRIPGSPGTFATPYTRYLYGEAMSVGERIGLELKSAVAQNALEKIVT